MVSGQPQYRVVVDPPVIVAPDSIPAGVTSVQSRLCFREIDSISDDFNYCPLGIITVPNDNFDGARMTLVLKNGADALPPAYPSSIGLLVSITGVRGDGHLDTLGTYRNGRVGGAPGTLVIIGPATAVGEDGGSVIFTATIGVNCLSGLTGPQCAPPGSTTGTVPPTISTQQPTTMVPEVGTTEGPTTTEPEVVTTENPTTTEPEMGTTEGTKPDIATTEDPATKKPDILTMEGPVTTETDIVTTESLTTTAPPTTMVITTATGGFSENPDREETTTMVTTESPNTEETTMEETTVRDRSTTVTTESLTTTTESMIFITGKEKLSPVNNIFIINLLEELENSVTSGIAVLIAFIVIAVLIALTVLAVLLIYCIKTRGRRVKNMWIKRRVYKGGIKMMSM